MPPPRVEYGLIWLAPVVIGVVAALSPPGANFDLGNYHYHNAWSWLNGRFDADLAPAWFHSYLNPLEDVPFYLGNRYLPGRLLAFLMGLIQGVSFPLLYLLARRLVFHAPSWRDAFGAAVSLAPTVRPIRRPAIKTRRRMPLSVPGVATINMPPSTASEPM